jgi:hypothetical protein
MQEWLNDPMIQASLAPFTVALAVAALLYRLRLGGLAAIAGFCTTAYLAGGLVIFPLTATRKLLLLGFIAPVLGLLADFAFKATRRTEVVLGLAYGAASAWVFWSILAQKSAAQGLLVGGGVALFVAWTVGSSASLREDGVRAGAAGLALGLGVGAAAVFAASALLGLYGMGLGAACGAVLLVQMIAGRRAHAGLTFALTFGALGALVGAAALVQANLGWTELLLFALVPLAARIPAPAKWPVWGQSVLISSYTLACAAAACAVAWFAARGAPG